MPLRFSIGIGSLGDENLILLTGLKETLKPKPTKSLKSFHVWFQSFIVKNMCFVNKKAYLIHVITQFYVKAY